jgi:restriction endonuclease Mrr
MLTKILSDRRKKTLAYSFEQAGLNFIWLKNFHISVSLLVESGKNGKESIVDSNNPLNEKIELSNKEALYMKEEILEFKNEISKIKEEEISQGMDDVIDYLNNNPHSSIEESFPDYVRKSKIKEDLVDENVNEEIVSDMLKKLRDVLQKCKEEGVDKKCLEEIDLSGITKKVLLENDSADLKTKIEGLVYDQLKEIIDLKLPLKEVFDRYQN